MSEHSEALLKKSTEVLDVILNTVKAGGEFAVEQLPDVAQQFIAYNIWWNGFAAFVNFAIAVFCSYTVVKVKKYGKRDRWNNLETDETAILFVACVACFICSIIFLVSMKDFMLFVLAPKVAIIQFFADFVK